ncbi:hypothetical protein GWK47_045937 [Chionoecetes opilio]|uniref:Uncharacterized protein n=1 Tax=Chionoecetes opilio TaxID=41210 RepID=A0A8J4Y5X1_CHIOP|nr:hypothetical protein GWK47_045937 [Chionoecetes opilio]
MGGGDWYRVEVMRVEVGLKATIASEECQKVRRRASLRSINEIVAPPSGRPAAVFQVAAAGMGRATACSWRRLAHARGWCRPQRGGGSSHPHLMANPEHHLALQVDVTQQSVVERVIAGFQGQTGRKPPRLLVKSAGVMRAHHFWMKRKPV